MTNTTEKENPHAKGIDMDRKKEWLAGQEAKHAEREASAADALAGAEGPRELAPDENATPEQRLQFVAKMEAGGYEEQMSSTGHSKQVELQLQQETPAGMTREIVITPRISGDGFSYEGDVTYWVKDTPNN